MENISTSSTTNTNDKFDLLTKSYKIINKSYLCYLTNVIGSGTFGKVIYGSSIDQQTEYAIKFEKSSIKSSVIEEEIKIYEALYPAEGIPKIHWTGEYKKYKLMIMDLLGPSLDKFFIACDKKFSVQTTLLIGEQMVQRLKYIHSKGYLHRDIKPNNFMLGRFSRSCPIELLNDKTIYVIDFGLSKEYVDFETNTHLPFKDNRRFIGTPRYASINTHCGIRQSRRDDLESIAYILIYFIVGELPWQGIKAKSKAEKKEKIKEVKMKINFEENTQIPKVFISFLNYCKGLQYEDTPDYNYIFKLFDSLKKKDYEKDLIWEWNMKFLSASQNSKHYKKYQGVFNKLYDGYPIISFDEFLVKLRKMYKLIRQDDKNYNEDFNYEEGINIGEFRKELTDDEISSR